MAIISAAQLTHVLAENIVDFFNEFTVFQEGLGPVCKFATFDLAEHGNKEVSAT